MKGLEGGRAGLEVRRKGMNKEEDRGWNGREELRKKRRSGDGS